MSNHYLGLAGSKAEHDRHTAPETRLFRHIILTAVLDAIWGNPGGDRKHDKSVRASALRWISEGGEDFALVCECAGLEPANVRKRSLEYINSELANSPSTSTRPPLHEHAAPKRRKAA